jgi:hypothetical protein
LIAPLESVPTLSRLELIANSPTLLDYRSNSVYEFPARGDDADLDIEGTYK